MRVFKRSNSMYSNFPGFFNEELGQRGGPEGHYPIVKKGSARDLRGHHGIPEAKN
jgi:hypothetical protein